MRLPIVAVALIAAACAPVRPQQKVKPFPYDGFSAAYPTGMRLVVYGLPHMPDVMVAASYRAGSVDDPPGKEGLAHLVEHLAFRARPGGKASIWNRLLAAGVEFNGLTSPDSTDYYAIGQPDQLGVLLQVEADRLRDPLAGVDETTFARERAVVIREYEERWADGDDARQVGWLRARALPGSPYARSASAASVGGLTLQDARDFVRRHYTPADVILVVTGPDAAQDAARRTLETMGVLATGDGKSRVPPTPSSPPRPSFDAPVSPEPAVHEAPVERPVLWMAWVVPGDADRGAPRAIAAAEHVEGRLKRVRRELGDAVVSVRCSTQRMDGASLVIARVALKRREEAPAVLAALRAERRFRVGVGGDDDVEWKRWIRDEMLMEAHLRLEALEVTDIARHLRTTGEPDYVGGWQKTVALSLTSDTTKEFVARYLDDARATTILVVPGGDRGRRARLPPAAHVEPADHHGPARPEDELVSQPPPPRRIGLAGAARRRLPNGLEVVIAPRPGFRAVDARLVFKLDPGGRMDDWMERLAAMSSACGLAGWGGSDELQRTPDAFVSVVHRPSDLLEGGLQQLSCRASQTTFDAPFFERLRRSVAEELERRPDREDGRERIDAALLSRLFPGEPFDSTPDGARVRAYRTSEARRFHELTFRPERASLILAGDVTPTPELWSTIERRFGGWRSAGVPAPTRPAPLPVPDRRQVVVVDRPGAGTAEITVGLRVAPRAARDEPAFRVMADHVVNGALQDLRVERSLTYSITHGLWETSRGAALLLRTTVETGSAPDATRTLLAALSATTGALPPAALDRARLRVSREHLHQFGTSARDGVKLTEAFVNGLPSDEWDTFGARLQEVTPQRVQAAARAAALGREVVVVTGDAAALAPALRSAGLTPEVLPATSSTSTAGR